MNNCGGRPNCESVPFNYGYHLNILVARLSMKTKSFRFVYTCQEIRRPTKEIRRPTTLPNTRMAPNRTPKINIKYCNTYRADRANIATIATANHGLPRSILIYQQMHVCRIYGSQRNGEPKLWCRFREIVARLIAGSELGEPFRYSTPGF